MKPLYRVSPFAVGLILSATVGGVASAAVLVSDSASFLSQVAPGYVTEDFQGVSSGIVGLTFDGGSGSFSYQISVTGVDPLLVPFGFADLYVNPAVSPLTQSITSVYPSGPSQPPVVTTTFVGTSVTAAGGNMFAVEDDPSPALIPGVNFTVTLTSALGGTQTFPVTSADPTPFVGFVTTTPGDYLTSISLSGASATAALSLDNFSVGAAVPEPTTVGLAAGIGLLGLAGLRTWRRIRA